MKGRPNTPKELKKLSGTYREDRDQGVLELEKVSEIPEPPEYLTEIGKSIWKEVTEIMITAQILESIDMHLVSMLCQELSTYYEASIKIKDKGMTYISGNSLVKRPEMLIREKAFDNAMKAMAQLGLTPSMRQKYGFTKEEMEEPDSNTSFY